MHVTRRQWVVFPGGLAASMDRGWALAGQEGVEAENGDEDEVELRAKSKCATWQNGHN